MPLNLDLLGKPLTVAPFIYDDDRVILYALGVGLGSEKADLRFVYEKHLQVFPTFGTMPFIRGFIDEFVPAAGINLHHLLHGEHRLVLHKPIPARGSLHTTLVWKAAYDKGDKGAVLQVNGFSRDGGGSLLFENRSLFIDRSAGNFSGERGPGSSPATPPEPLAPPFRVSLETAPHQAALFRLSGDKNPLHIDPGFAHEAGFDTPILHGLCSLGFACRGVLTALCDNDPSRLISIGARFVNVVYPGDRLITEGWPTDAAGACRFRTINQSSEIILTNASAEIQLPPS